MSEIGTIRWDIAKHVFRLHPLRAGPAKICSNRRCSPPIPGRRSKSELDKLGNLKSAQSQLIRFNLSCTSFAQPFVNLLFVTWPLRLRMVAMAQGTVFTGREANAHAFEGVVETPPGAVE